MRADDLDLMVEDHHGVTVAVAAGRLGIRNTAWLERQLGKLLLDAGRVVVDVSGLQPTSSAMLAIFPTVLSGAGGWPTARLALQAVDGPVIDGMRATGRDRDVPTAASRELAVALLDCRPARVLRWIDLPPTLAAPTIARVLLRSACIDWEIHPDVVERATLVANELVSNAVVHTSSVERLTLSHDRTGMWIGVRDGSPVLPVVPEASDLLGLRTVVALSRRWGVRPHPVGKTVWALLDTAQGGPGITDLRAPSPPS